MCVPGYGWQGKEAEIINNILEGVPQKMLSCAQPRQIRLTFK